MGEGSEMPPPLRFKYIYTFKLNKTFNYGGHRKIISYGGRGTEWGGGGWSRPTPKKLWGVQVQARKFNYGGGASHIIQLWGRCGREIELQKEGVKKCQAHHALYNI